MSISNGTSGSDSLFGSIVEDSLSGGLGNDTLNGSFEADLLCAMSAAVAARPSLKSPVPKLVLTPAR